MNEASVTRIIQISMITTLVLGLLSVILYFTVYKKSEKFDYEPQELADRGKELLDSPEEKFTDEEYKLRLQKVYPYTDKDETMKMSVEGSDE